MKRGLEYAVFCAILATMGSAQASDINEQEPNDTVYAAQQVDVPADGVGISAVLGNLTGSAVYDYDFYKFYAQQDDLVDIDIDGAWGGARSFDSFIAVFDAGNMKMLAKNDDGRPLDPGSVSTLDSRIDKFHVPHTGYYIVGVTSWPRCFLDGGAVTLCAANYPNFYMNGDYKLLISGASSPMIHISIDIKPGSDAPAPINLTAKGKVPVALLSSSTFNALLVDKTSLTFGATGDEHSLSSCGDGEDVNGDGFVDLVCHFNNRDTHFSACSTEGIVHGKMQDGRAIEGRGMLKVVPQKCTD